jgi:hypothetical protein
MGMKTAALSMSAIMELYSWQERHAYYNMTLDVEAIGKERTNTVELPDPTLMNELPDDIADLLRKPMGFPNSAAEQELLVNRGENFSDRLGPSGTIVYMPDCDRLTYVKARTLVEHAVKEMSRVYRRPIASGLRLFVNNRLVEAFDPTYSMPSARHARLIDLPAKTSRLLFAKPVDIPIREHGSETDQIIIRLYKLPIEEWSTIEGRVITTEGWIHDEGPYGEHTGTYGGGLPHNNRFVVDCITTPRSMSFCARRMPRFG